MGDPLGRTNPCGRGPKRTISMTCKGSGRYKWYQSRLSGVPSVGPWHLSVHVGGLASWQATARGCAALWGVDCKAPVSHIGTEEGVPGL